MSDVLRSLAEEWVGSKIRVFTRLLAASVKINIILLTEQATMPMYYIEASLHFPGILQQLWD